MKPSAIGEIYRGVASRKSATSLLFIKCEYRCMPCGLCVRDSNSSDASDSNDPR